MPNIALTLAALLACGGAEPVAAPPAPAPTAAPAPAPVAPPPDPATLPPPTPAKGGPLLLIPGQYLPDELPLADGEEVQVICEDQLVTDRVSLVPVGEGRVTPVVSCPKWPVLFRGVSDRIGAGSIRPGLGRGPVGPTRPRDVEAGFVKGFLELEPKDAGYTLYLNPDEGQRVALVSMTDGTHLAGLTWIGDLDDDNVPDLCLNTPHSTTEAHLRLFLSAASATRQPEQVAELRFTLW